MRHRTIAASIGVAALSATLLPPASADHGGPGFQTAEPAYLTVSGSAPAGTVVVPIISTGDETDGFRFEGIPDGIGVAPGEHGLARVFVAHEQSTVPFLGRADFQDSSVSELLLDPADSTVHGAEVALPASAGFLRFCSAFMAGPDQGFDRWTLFLNEETNDVVDVPAGAPYGPDPALAPQRQGGYAVAYDVASGTYTEVPGMGRLNHENSVVIPGRWNRKPIWTTDDTFSAGTSQLYSYFARNSKDVRTDRGSLWAFRVTRTDEGRVDETDPFNGANDYLDIAPGDDWQGRFLRVPKQIARGETGVAPQQALEDWSNANNVFQFIRLEDVATDVNDPRTVYVADTGSSRIVPDPVTGRMVRGPSGTVGLADNGRIFRFVVDARNPKKVASFSVLADGDADPADPAYADMRAPDNLGTSAASLMVQEDASDARVLRLDLQGGGWSHVATVANSDGESSGIVDASEWFGDGAWLATVQVHDPAAWVDSEVVSPELTLKREAGQLVLLRVPGS